MLSQEELLARHAGLAAADGFTVHARARRTASEATPLVALRFRCGSITCSSLDALNALVQLGICCT